MHLRKKGRWHKTEILGNKKSKNLSEKSGTCVMHVRNGITQCLLWKSPTIYRRNVRRGKNNRSVSVHTSVDCGDVW